MNCRPQCQGDTIIRHRAGARSKKKKCRKEKHLDCIDEEKLEEQENRILKITYQKCKEEKKKAGEKKHGPLTTIRCVPFSEVVMNRIKPSMETREKFLAARHLDCILGTVRTVDLTAIREELKRPKLLKRLCTEPVDRRRKRKKKKRREGKEKEGGKQIVAERAKSRSKDSAEQQDEDAAGAQRDSEDAYVRMDSEETEERAASRATVDSKDVADRAMVSEEEARESKDNAEDEPSEEARESQDNGEPKDSTASREGSESKDADKPKDSSASRGSRESKERRSRDSRSKSKARKRDRPDKFWCEKMKKPVKEATSYTSEKLYDKCESVCSFDSDVCLAGLALTVKDKKAISENRERVRGGSKNNEGKNNARKK